MGSDYEQSTEKESELSFDISNNQLAASLTRNGKIKRACICEGVVPLAVEKLKGGVYSTKRLLYGGPWLLKANVDTVNASPGKMEVSLIENCFPMFTQEFGKIRIHQFVFAPVDLLRTAQSPRALIAIFLIENRGGTPHAIDFQLEDAIDEPKDDLSLAAAGQASDLAVDAKSRASFAYARFDQNGYIGMALSSITSRIHVEANSIAASGHALMLGESPAEVLRTQTRISSKTLSSWLQDTLESRRESYGHLVISGETFFSESVIRFSELSRQSALRSSDGKVSGGFLGSDVDLNQVNWVRDSYYSMLAMSLVEPSLCRDSIPYLLEWGRPSVTTGAGQARFPGVKSISQSLSNSVSGLALAAMYYRSTGDREFFTARPEILRRAKTILDEVLASRRTSAMLFPSLYFSDGEARGDFHTGSNVAAWVAFSGMARIADDVYRNDVLAKEWSTVAGDIRQAIDAHCVKNGPAGQHFVEGVNVDGTFVMGHDGEESETTLMPFYGFCGADDLRLINHAASAMTAQNPLYSEDLDAIWWYNSDWNSATFPGWTTALAGAWDEVQILDRLQRIRSLTDLDGSLWWWPYAYGSKDPNKPTRGGVARKCGWGTAVYLCLFIHDILGISVDAPAQSIRFAPFAPWKEFVWKQATIGWSTFDLSYRRDGSEILATLKNLNTHNYSATIVITPEKDKHLRHAKVVGGREVRQRFIEHRGRQAIEIMVEIPSYQQVRVTGEVGP
ncbi:hypothetical protein AciPR4_1095 [Terriglobus saanensis SP1PR4]|uniref:Glycosyl hydrolase 36 catalytic domain-containing protein n=1 Tax=Terriglobus saanensis (strain ATCC BAA-1853 / DSM 23119 / SP1PR4) TaxID=401053 RepID=E8UX38_TERSS|nr:hypothetical protein AciPR4_1095 [Terriglobus saanensis SP1PR4]